MVCDRLTPRYTENLTPVLILILLEYGLRRDTFYRVPRLTPRLNPYSIGIWSATDELEFNIKLSASVLILILLEYGLRQHNHSLLLHRQSCLNPYSIGIWSATHLECNKIEYTKVS